MGSEFAAADGQDRCHGPVRGEGLRAVRRRATPRRTSTTCWLAGDFNAVALGFYKKAYDLFALSASQLTAPLHNVALATLSRLNQDQARFRRYLANSLGIIAFVGMAASADLTLVGKDVVRLVLGPQWSESGRIFELFGPGIGAMLLYGIVGWIHLSIGKPGRLLRWSLVELALTASLFLAALPWGPAGIAAAWSISYWILLIPGFWYAGRPIGFGVSALIAAIWRYAVAALAAGLATAAIIRGTPFSACPRQGRGCAGGNHHHFIAVCHALFGHGHPFALGLGAAAPACESSARVGPVIKTGRRGRGRIQMRWPATPAAKRRLPAISQASEEKPHSPALIRVSATSNHCPRKCCGGRRGRGVPGRWPCGIASCCIKCRQESATLRRVLVA